MFADHVIHQQEITKVKQNTIIMHDFGEFNEKSFIDDIKHSKLGSQKSNWNQPST